DVGTSGGVWGLERGYCLMIGGEPAVVERLEPIFKTLAPGRGNIPRTPGREGVVGTVEQGYLHCGPSGAGHFVKMIHNGIEYGVMQAYAEGLDILKNANAEALEPDQRYELNVADITEGWRRGSVVSPWLLDPTAQALVENPTPSNHTGGVAGPVVDGRWEAVNLPWKLDEATLAATVGAKRAKLLNDLEATGHGMLGLPPSSLVSLQTGVARRGNMALLAAGTGLGEALIV